MKMKLTNYETRALEIVKRESEESEYIGVALLIGDLAHFHWPEGRRSLSTVLSGLQRKGLVAIYQRSGCSCCTKVELNHAEVN
jgi:hypothetical protein